MDRLPRMAENPTPSAPQELNITDESQPPAPRRARGRSLSDRLGIGGLALTLITLAVPILWPDRKLVGWLFFSSAIALLIAWTILEFREFRSRVTSNKRRSRGMRLSKKAGLVIVGIVLIALAIFFALWARPSVHPPFQEAYDRYRGRLGRPEGKTEALKWA